MKHICNVNCFGHKFGITIDESIDNPGMYRLIREDNGDEIEDMIETEEKAIRTICNKYPDNDSEEMKKWKETKMRHICNANFHGYKFGIALDKSIDNPGMLRLIDETDNSEIEDMFETEEEAIEAVYIKYPGNDL